MSLTICPQRREKGFQVTGGFICHQSFDPAQFVKCRHHLLEISSPLVIDNCNAAKIGAFAFSSFADVAFISQQRDSRDSFLNACGSRDDGAGVVPFPAAANARETLTAGLGRGHADDDFAAIIEVLEGLAGGRL